MVQVLIFQYIDRFGGIKFIPSNDFKDVVDLIYSMDNLSDCQARRWGNRFLTAQAQWRPDKTHVMNGQGFRVWGVPEDIKTLQGKKVRLQREEVLQRVLISYVNGNIPIRFTIQQSGPWTTELEITNNNEINFWVAYSEKDEPVRISQVHIINGRCISDFKLTETLQQYIVQVNKGLLLQRILSVK